MTEPPPVDEPDLRAQRMDSIVWTPRPGYPDPLECFRCREDIPPATAYWSGLRPGARTRACQRCHAETTPCDD